LADFPSRPLIDFGIGENDAMAPKSVRRRMADEINNPENRGYMDNGNPPFKEAAASFMQRTFGVKLDPVTQVNHTIGSKPALAMLPACFINPGDITLMTVPGYPVAGTHTRYYGGSIFRPPPPPPTSPRLYGARPSPPPPPPPPQISSPTSRPSRPKSGSGRSSWFSI